MLPLSSGIPPALPTPDKYLSARPAFQPRQTFSLFAWYFFLWLATAYCCPLGRFPCPEFLDPFALCPALLDSLVGRDSHRLLRVRCPSCGISDLSTYPVAREPEEVPALLTQ